MSHTSWYVCVCIYPVTVGAIYYLRTDQDQQDQPTRPQRSVSSALFSISRTKNLVKQLLATPTHTVDPAITLYVLAYFALCIIFCYMKLSLSLHIFFFSVSDISKVSAHTFQGVATSQLHHLVYYSATAAFEVRALLSSSWLALKNQQTPARWDKTSALCLVPLVCFILRLEINK